MHLGDDAYTLAPGLRRPRGPVARYGHHIAHGLAVPYRIAQWLPRGELPAAANGKHLLLFANINPKKHVVRARIARSIANQSARLGLASEYVDAFGQLGGRSSTIVVPADAANVPSVLGQALAAYDGLQQGAGAKRGSKSA